uniref:Uncharacterized protein n=1 Tax=viral metagenome TaxID=1070528 RepID=A0A6M3X427_9ZZZZ
MALLNDANEVYLGPARVDEVYLGASLVWQRSITADPLLAPTGLFGEYTEPALVAPSNVQGEYT